MRPSEKTPLFGEQLFWLSFSLILLQVLSGCQAPIWNLKDKADPAPEVLEAEKSDCAHKFKKLNACFNLEWITVPVMKGEGKLSLRFQDFSSGRLEKLELKAFLWMPEHGHGSANVLIEGLPEDGFILSRLRYFMPGHWELHLQMWEDEEEVDAYVFRTDI
jgi:hypothetical protein